MFLLISLLFGEYLTRIPEPETQAQTKEEMHAEKKTDLLQELDPTAEHGDLQCHVAASHRSTIPHTHST
jgi:hypothetical protein